MCRECIRLPENREHISLNVIRNDFIFSVESTGCVSAETLLPRVRSEQNRWFKGIESVKRQMWNDHSGSGSNRNRRCGNASRRRVGGNRYGGGRRIVPLCECVWWKKRQLQDSNLRGQSPTDFESVSLTTRTNCLTKTLGKSLYDSLTLTFQTHLPSYCVLGTHLTLIEIFRCWYSY